MEHLEDQALNRLLKLAQKYNKKYRSLLQVSEDTPLVGLLPQLMQRAELLTDRFRSLQQSALRQIDPSAPKDTDIFETILSLSECFDETLILFHVLAEKTVECANRKS